MITDRLQQVIDAAKGLPPEDQDRLADAIRKWLDQPSVTSDVVRPEAMAAFEQVMDHSAGVLEYLRDR